MRMEEVIGQKAEDITSIPRIEVLSSAEAGVVVNNHFMNKSVGNTQIFTKNEETH